MAARIRKPRHRRRRPTRRRATRGRSPLSLWLIAIATLAIAIVVVGQWRRSRPVKPEARHLTMAQARAVNAAIPFVPGKVAAAQPFHFKGTPAARLQATQCLATAAIYEAGSDERGQRAVMQIILNRVRDPAFPKTVCGVVYQGASLKTGCQFSFTCDGSALRRPEHSGWVAARTIAGHALSGTVFRPVGTATHYHADWVVPYWIGSLDKIAQVHSHIFYRRRS
jgi:spore germination cell wall hydrolase CwlJ-like protein